MDTETYYLSHIRVSYVIWTTQLRTFSSRWGNSAYGLFMKECHSDLKPSLLPCTWLHTSHPQSSTLAPAFSFHLYMGYGDQTPVTRLVWRMTNVFHLLRSLSHWPVSLTLLWSTHVIALPSWALGSPCAWSTARREKAGVFGFYGVHMCLRDWEKGLGVEQEIGKTWRYMSIREHKTKLKYNPYFNYEPWG